MWVWTQSESLDHFLLLFFFIVASSKEKCFLAGQKANRVLH